MIYCSPTEACMMSLFELWSTEVGVICTSPTQVIMFLSRTDEETTSNRKLAKDLVDKWVMSKIIVF